MMIRKEITMKGIRTLILQDLSHVLPPKNLQGCLVSNPLQMHTTACPRRFWTFFDFSKGESRGNKECYESKDMVSPSLFPNSDLDDVSKSPSSNTTETFSPWYSNECQFDLKSMPMNCLRVQRPPKEESLVSLLDGHSVPKMLKWKLKGYKTLRNEKAIDFAFVPGGKSHEFDILPRNERRTSKVTDDLDDTAERQESLAIRKKTGDNDKKDTLRLTTKVIEKNKVETEVEDIDKIVENGNGLETDKSRNVSNQNLAKLGSSVRKEDVKYLPILKSSELKYQTQPAARFSSRPPKKIRKPSAPILKRADCEKLDKEIPSMEFDEEKDVLEPEEKRAASKPSVPKFSELTENPAEWSSVESQGNQEYPVERETKTEETKSNSLESSAEASPQSEPNAFETVRSRDASSTESPAEDLDRVADEKQFESRSSAYFAPVERGRMKTEETKSDTKDYDSLESSVEASPQSEPNAFETTRLRDASSTESPAEDLDRVADEKRFEPRSSAYFAPVERGRMKTEETKSDAKDYDSLESSAEASPQSEPNAFETTRSREASSTESPAEDLGRAADEKRFEPRSSVYFAPRASKQNPRSSIAEGMTLESIIGIPERTTPRLNITRPDESRVRSSPCAATRARLLQSGNRSASSSQMDSFGNGKSQSVPGNSDGGSRKPPASFPPVAIKRSSSNASCLLGKPSVSKGTDSAPSSKNSSLNISTSSANPARKCREENDECSRTRRKKCERERPCKSDKKTCKRYCCPALQAPTSCNFNKFHCPKDTYGQSVQPRKVRDPTCLPNDEYNDQGKAFCTTPRKREDCNRSCSRERSGPCSERRRSCQREYSEQEDCSQEQAREICTKPRKRDNSCKRQRRCNDRDCSRRSAKCTGRRNYTQSACSSRCKLTRNVKHYSSTPAFVSPLIVRRENLFVSSPIYHPPRSPPFRSKSDDKSRPSSKCKLTVEKCKKEEPCRKKKDPCAETRGTCNKEKDPCKKKKRPSCEKEDPCKKTRPTCKKAETSCGPEVKRVDDPCKKARSMSKAIDDSCKKSSKSKTDDKLKCSATTDDTCSAKREQMCQEKKVALSPKDSSESLEDKIKRERKEVEDCKKHIDSKKKEKEKKEATVAGLERVISPCKQQLKDKKAKFASINFPLQNFMHSVADTCTKQASNLLNLSSDRLYSVRSSNSDEINRETDPPDTIRNFWSFNEGDVEEIPIPLIENQDNGPEDGSNWFLPWFTNY